MRWPAANSGPMTADEREQETSGPLSSFPGASSSGLMPGLAEIRAAWIGFYDAHYHRVVRFVMHNDASLQDAHDAAQEAFTESWAPMVSHPDRWLAVTSKEAWIRMVALRRYRRPPGPRIRPRLAEGAGIPDLPHPGLEPGELTIQAQMVLQALRGLAEQQRSVMAFYLDDFSTTAIADALNLTDEEVRDVKKRARAALKIALDGTMSPGRRQP
jgi:RNA polymerase sigma factor (sigma-70 family)